MKIDMIRKIPPFATLKDEEFEGLRSIFVTRSYRKNQIIFLEEETGQYMYLVLSGKLKVAKSGIGDKEVILAIHKSGDFFGEMSLLDGKTSPATVSAMEDSRIVVVSAADFHKYLMRNEQVMLQIIQVLCARLRQVWQTQSQSFHSAETRIRLCLYDLARKHGVRDYHGTIIDLKITHQEMADMARTTRETVTRTLSRLKEEKIIDIINRRITLLDEEALIMKD